MDERQLIRISSQQRCEYKKILKEYASLISKPNLSEDEAGRIEEILEIAHLENVLSFLINEMDEISFRELEIPEGDIESCKKDLMLIKINMSQKNKDGTGFRAFVDQLFNLESDEFKIAREYYFLVVMEKISEKQADRIDEILYLAQENNTLNLLINEIDELTFEKFGFDDVSCSYFESQRVVAQWLIGLSNQLGGEGEACESYGQELRRRLMSQALALCEDEEQSPLKRKTAVRQDSQKMSLGSERSGLHSRIISTHESDIPASFTKGLHKDEDMDTSINNSVLSVLQQCKKTELYIQIVMIENAPVLVTNIGNKKSPKVLKNAPSWLIGRNPNCDIVIANSGISRRHAVIKWLSENRFHITDLGSTNGSRLNQERLHRLESQVIQNGDLIEFNNLKAEFYIVHYS